MRSFLLRMFGRPKGVLGRLGGIIMGRMNADCSAWVSDLLAVGPNDVGSGLRTGSDYFEAGGRGTCRGR
jgi:hypothetical protein